MDIYDRTSPESILNHASKMLNKCLFDVLDDVAADEVREDVEQYGQNRKGHFGDLVEKYVFGIENNNRAEADFPEAGVELKTTPLKKHSTKRFVSKERLVFSMIDYMTIIDETWEDSSFLEKNKILLLMFYLFEPHVNLYKYKFKIIHINHFLRLLV